MIRILSILVLTAALLPRLGGATPALNSPAAADGGLVAVPSNTARATTNAVSQTVRYVTYRQACIEGWAAKPTNAVQRAIHKKVLAERRQGPTNPILIRPGQLPLSRSK